MAALSPFSLHVTDQITAVLRDAWPKPLSTGEIEARTGYGIRYGQMVYRMLHRLVARGEAEKVPRPGMRSCYWRLARTEDSRVMAAWEALVRNAAMEGSEDGG